MGLHLDTTLNRLRRAETAERDLRNRAEVYGWRHSDYLEKRTELLANTRKGLPTWACERLNGLASEWLTGLYNHRRPAVKWVLYVNADGSWIEKWDGLPELIKEQTARNVNRGQYFWIETRRPF